ncbi:unnamed protein product [Bathycoccus prasinos]
MYRPEHSPEKRSSFLRLNTVGDERVLSETNFQATREHEQQRFNSSFARDVEERGEEERLESLTRREEESSSNAILERFLKKLERDFQGEKKNGVGAQFLGTDQQPQNRLQNQKEKTDDTFHLLRKTLEESKSSLENERSAYASNVLELERAKRDVISRTKEAMEEAKRTREMEDRENKTKERGMREEIDRLKRTLRDFERKKENEIEVVERRCVDAVNRAKEKELKIEEACKEKIRRMSEEKIRDLETMQMKHNMEMEHVRSKLGEKSEDESEIRKKMREMESELEKARRDARRAKEEKERLREQAGVARKKLEELMETMKTRDTSRDAEIELIREESGRREEEFMETVKTNELKRDREVAELLERSERDAKMIARLEKRAQTAETASIAVKFLCEEAQKSIEDSEIAAAYAERRAARLASGFGSSSSSDVSSSDDDEDDNEYNDKEEKEKSKVKFRKRADAANLRLERSLRDARATLRECIERKKTMLLETEYDDVNDENDAASYEEKRREVFAFNVVKDVADIRVSFLTRAIASVRLSRRCGALEGLIAGRADRTVDEDEEECGKNIRKDDEDNYRSMNTTIDTIEEEEDEDDDDDDLDYVSW